MLYNKGITSKIKEKRYAESKKVIVARALTFIWKRNTMPKLFVRSAMVKGAIYPKYDVGGHCRLTNGRIQRNQCHHQTTVTAGTIMHRSHAPLTKLVS